MNEIPPTSVLIETSLPFFLGQSISPLSFIITGFIVGFVFEKLILPRLIRVSYATRWNTNEIIFINLQRRIFLLFVLFGLYGATFSTPLPYQQINLIATILIVCMLLVLTIIIAQISSDLIKFYANKASGPYPATSLLANLTKLSLFIAGSLIILQSLGISITPLLTALGVGGIAVALALQDTLSNIFSGIYTLASQQIKPGDYIMLDSGQEGHILDITWRNTTIQQLTNNIVIVPNSKLASAIITNYHLQSSDVGVKVELTISYDSDLEKVEEVTKQVAREVLDEVEGAVKTYEPVVRFKQFLDSGVLMLTILRANDFTTQYLVRHEFVKRLQSRFKQEEIVIPYPQRTVHLKQ